MGRKLTLLVGYPVIHDKTLDVLRGKFGRKKGFELYKAALALKELGWYKLSKSIDRRSILRLRSHLLESGCLGGVYEDDISLEEMSKHILEMQV